MIHVSVNWVFAKDEKSESHQDTIVSQNLQMANHDSERPARMGRAIATGVCGGNERYS